LAMGLLWLEKKGLQTRVQDHLAGIDELQR
jgi:hypothetical protein